MPFDGNITPKQRRAMLIHELRNLKDWDWNFNQCRKCAMGILYERFGVKAFEEDRHIIHPEVIGPALGISEKDISNILIGCGFRGSQYPITPQMVADALEAL